jgi:hypothetical protein
MATNDWPEALIPQTAQLALRKAGTQFSSPFNGTLQALDFIGERWVLSASLAQMSARNPRGVGAFCNTLAGGVERVRVWPFHTGGVPRGTLRGAPTISLEAARGNSSLTLANAAAGSNLLRGSSFEIDTDADGRADNWLAYSAGGTGTVTYSRVSGFRGAWAQRVDSTALGPEDADRAGVRYSIDVPVTPGSSYALAAHVRASAGEIALNVDWRDAGNAFLATSALVVAAATFWQRHSFAATAPAGAAFARIFVWQQDIGASAAAAWLEVDNVQFEIGSQATEYLFLASLRAGDFIGCGGQLFQVAEDKLLNDMGAGVVNLVNRVRGTIASGSAVTWYRPTCEMVLPAMQAGPVRRPGVIESTALDLVEVW